MTEAKTVARGSRAEWGVLKDHLYLAAQSGEVPFRQMGDVGPVQCQYTGFDVLEAKHDTQQGGFPGSGFADKAERRAG